MEAYQQTERGSGSCSYTVFQKTLAITLAEKKQRKFLCLALINQKSVIFCFPRNDNSENHSSTENDIISYYNCYLETKTKQTVSERGTASFEVSNENILNSK